MHAPFLIVVVATISILSSTMVGTKAGTNYLMQSLKNLKQQLMLHADEDISIYNRVLNGSVEHVHEATQPHLTALHAAGPASIPRHPPLVNCDPKCMRALMTTLTAGNAQIINEDKLLARLFMEPTLLFLLIATPTGMTNFTVTKAHSTELRFNRAFHALIAHPWFRLYAHDDAFTNSDTVKQYFPEYFRRIEIVRSNPAKKAEEMAKGRDILLNIRFHVSQFLQGGIPLAASIDSAMDGPAEHPNGIPGKETIELQKLHKQLRESARELMAGAIDVNGQAFEQSYSSRVESAWSPSILIESRMDLLLLLWARVLPHPFTEELHQLERSHSSPSSLIEDNVRDWSALFNTHDDERLGHQLRPSQLLLLAHGRQYVCALDSAPGHMSGQFKVTLLLAMDAFDDAIHRLLSTPVVQEYFFSEAPKLLELKKAADIPVFRFLQQQSQNFPNIDKLDKSLSDYLQRTEETKKHIPLLDHVYSVGESVLRRGLRPTPQHPLSGRNVEKVNRLLTVLVTRFGYVEEQSGRQQQQQQKSMECSFEDMHGTNIKIGEVFQQFLIDEFENYTKEHGIPAPSFTIDEVGEQNEVLDGHLQRLFYDPHRQQWTPLVETVRWVAERHAFHQLQLNSVEDVKRDGVQPYDLTIERIMIARRPVESAFSSFMERLLPMFSGWNDWLTEQKTTNTTANRVMLVANWTSVFRQTALRGVWHLARTIHSVSGCFPSSTDNPAADEGNNPHQQQIQNNEDNDDQQVKRRRELVDRCVAKTFTKKNMSSATVENMARALRTLDAAHTVVLNQQIGDMPLTTEVKIQKALEDLKATLASLNESLGNIAGGIGEKDASNAIAECLMAGTIAERVFAHRSSHHRIIVRLKALHNQIHGLCQASLDPQWHQLYRGVNIQKFEVGPNIDMGNRFLRGEFVEHFEGNEQLILCGEIAKILNSGWSEPFSVNLHVMGDGWKAAAIQQYQNLTLAPGKKLRPKPCCGENAVALHVSSGRAASRDGDYPNDVVLNNLFQGNNKWGVQQSGEWQKFGDEQFGELRIFLAGNGDIQVFGNGYLLGELPSSLLADKVTHLTGEKAWNPVSVQWLPFNWHQLPQDQHNAGKPIEFRLVGRGLRPGQTLQLTLVRYFEKKDADNRVVEINLYTAYGDIALHLKWDLSRQSNVQRNTNTRQKVDATEPEEFGWHVERDSGDQLPVRHLYDLKIAMDQESTFQVFVNGWKGRDRHFCSYPRRFSPVANQVKWVQIRGVEHWQLLSARLGPTSQLVRWPESEKWRFNEYHPNGAQETPLFGDQ